MYVFRKKLKKFDMGGGVIRQYLGEGKKVNAQHWDMADKSIVKWHKHTQEQFGYVIKGGFKMMEVGMGGHQQHGPGQHQSDQDKKR